MTAAVVTAEDKIAAAWQAMEAAREAFREQAKAGFTGAREYLAWVTSIQAVTAAGGIQVNEYEDAHRARDDEYNELAKEARRLHVRNRSLFEQAGPHAVRQWEADRAAWLERASAYAGHEVTVVDVSVAGGIVLDPQPHGSERPQAVFPPEPLPYLEALMTACRD